MPYGCARPLLYYLEVCYSLVQFLGGHKVLLKNVKLVLDTPCQLDIVKGQVLVETYLLILKLYLEKQQVIIMCVTLDQKAGRALYIICRVDPDFTNTLVGTLYKLDF